MNQVLVHSGLGFGHRAVQITAAAAAFLFLGASTAHAQSLQAFDDTFGIPSTEWLDVEAFGVLENDILDEESAGEMGATASLVTNVSHGTLNLASDGAFTYAPGPTFDGTDQFVYSAAFGAVTSQATVTLTACEGGPEIFNCWNETAFLALAASHGLPSFQEGFEDDVYWGGARAPNSAPAVSSRGFEWRANDFDPTHVALPYPPSPAPNEIITSGPGLTGAWLGSDLQHGYSPLAGNAVACDIPAPPVACYEHDGITLMREQGSNTLHGAGGYFHSINAAGTIAFVIDGDWQNPIGAMGFHSSHDKFFGVLSTGPTGFNEIQFREVEGRPGDSFMVWSDDFTVLAVPTALAVPSSNVLGMTALATLMLAAAVRSISEGKRFKPRFRRSCR